MTEQPQDNTEEISHGETGRRLKAAREKAGLDLQTLADQLHLRPVIVRAIEEGDYRSVPSELFLKGYVRSYARHIGISDDEMIQMLTRELAPEKDSEEEEYASGRLPVVENHRRKQKMSLLGLVLVVFVLLLLPFIWPETEEPETGPETGMEAPDAQQQEESGQSEEAGDSDASATDDSGSDVGPALNDAQTPASSPQSPEEPPQTVDPVSPPPQPESEPGLEPEPEPETSAQVSALDEAQLQIRFTGDCWVEVVNGDGRTVVARLATAGEQVSYQGPGPLNILLGAVDAVERLEFMGQTLDLSQYPARAGRTRFQLAVNDFVSDQD